MPNNPPDPASDPEETRTLSDQQMIFRLAEDHTPHSPSKKMKQKAAKLKMRKSTPAPPTKGTGRKRFVPSPLPEDKKPWKKLEFGSEEPSPPGSPKCKGNIFPASMVNEKGDDKDENENTTQPAMHEQSDTNKKLDLEQQMPVCEAFPNNSLLSGQGSGQTAGEGSVAVEVTVIQPSQDNTLVLVDAKAKGVLGEVRVKLPEMDMGTKELLESGLDSYHNGDSRDPLDLGAHVQPNSTNLLHVASLDSADMLDIMETQPLIDAGKVDPGRPAFTPKRVLWLRNEPSPITPSSAFKTYQEEFPPLEKGRTLKLRDSFESSRPRGTQPSSSSQPSQDELKIAGDMGCFKEAHANPVITPNVATQVEKVMTLSKEETMASQLIEKPLTEMNATQSRDEEGVGADPSGTKQAGGNVAGKGNTNPNTRRSMADMFKGALDPDGPQVFAPDKLQTIGLATTSNGIPAIYFSGVEIRKLAENMGHAIVGKFSHSIPTSGQIQKALNNIKFQRGFTWKYINAKHILIQCEELADYAKILSGPKGTPVWFIDRHPMRVFKWSPEFDAYCESPIAAIWCNLIGLPIHLFDQSALFAIGKLLGTPIQVDRATANKTRLSFARICVEIDITKPPPEEIILDICGREMVQQVRWDKIPAYCRECKHVGHASNVCYASGKNVRPAKRNYSSATPNKATQDGNDQTGMQANPTSNPTDTNEWKRQGRNKGKGTQPKAKPIREVRMEPEWEGPDIVGDLLGKDVFAKDQPITRELQREEANVKSSKEPRRPLLGKEDEAMDDSWEQGDSPRRVTSYSRGGSRGGLRGGSRGGWRQPMSNGGRKGDEWMGNVMSTNKYYSLMANGEYDVDGCGEEDVDVMDDHSLCAHDKESPPLIGAEVQAREREQQIALVQGGPSHLPGTDSLC